MGNNAYQQLESILNTAAGQIKQVLLKKAERLRPFPTFYAGIGKGAREVPHLGQASEQLQTLLVRTYVKMLVPGNVHEAQGMFIYSDKDREHRIFTPTGLYRCPDRFFFNERNDGWTQWNPEDRITTYPAWDLREEDINGYATHCREILERVQDEIHELPRKRAERAEQERRLKEHYDYAATLQD